MAEEQALKMTVPVHHHQTALRPAMNHVFGITELFEQVLLHLPIERLLVYAQLVSKHWRNTILQSPALQERLFLRRIRRPYRASDYIRLNLFGELISFKEHTNRTAAFEYPEACWRRMLIIQPPVPMSLERDSKTIRFSCFASSSRDGNGKERARVYPALTFGDVEEAMQGTRMNVIVETNHLVYWRTAAFEPENGQLHWSTW